MLVFRHFHNLNKTVIKIKNAISRFQRRALRTSKLYRLGATMQNSLHDVHLQTRTREIKEILFFITKCGKYYLAKQVAVT